VSWRVTRLHEICDLENGDRGKNYPGKSALLDEGVPFVNAGDLKDGSLRADGLSYISPEHFQKLNNGKFSEGDFLFCLRGSLGKFAVIDRPIKGAIASSLIIIRPGHALYPSYLKNYLASALCREQIGLYANGAAQPNLAASSLKQFEIPLPPLDEQKRIAAILDKADHLRQKRRQAIALLDSVSSSLIEEIVNETSSRSISLGDCLSFVTSGGRNWSRYYAESGDRFIRSLDVQMNFIANEDVVFVQAPDNAEARRTRTEIGDVLLTITGSRIGRVAALTDVGMNSYVSQHVAILRPIVAKIDSVFLSFFLSSSAGQRQIAKWQYGQTKPGLNFEQIRSFEIPDVSMGVQQHFVSKMRVMASRSVVANKQDVMLGSLFASLQHRAFAGKL
tara:strand:+ start:3197 stop:4369 length:1173 start_codon:yes stop_codon:yes gene_type:complete